MKTKNQANRRIYSVAGVSTSHDLKRATIRYYVDNEKWSSNLYEAKLYPLQEAMDYADELNIGLIHYREKIAMYDSENKYHHFVVVAVPLERL